MSWSKRELVTAALDEIGIQGYEFDVSPEEDATMLRRLDAMMGVWEGKGIRVGYNFPASAGESNPDDDSGLPDMANEPVFLNLGIRAAPSYGKAVSPDTKANAKDGYDTLLRIAAYPSQQQMPNTLPRGAGNKPWRTTNNAFFNRPNLDPLQITQGGDLRVLPE